MFASPKIALSIPHTSKPDRYFSFRLKQEMDNEPSVYRNPKRILVVSDTEGNFHSFCKLLLKGRVINKYLQWIFEDNHLVIVGDCFERGEQAIECLWLIYSLEEKARAKGGYVHFILGSREISNLNGDWRYVHPKYAEITKSQRPPTALYDGNNELWRWLQTKNIMEKIGSILFVYGGISEELLKLNISITNINNRVRPYYTRAHELFTDPLLNMIFNNETSPFGYGGYYHSETGEELIDATLAQFNVKTIVTGQTITDKIISSFNGKVINVDADHAAGTSVALLVIKEQFYRVHKSGKRERLK